MKDTPERITVSIDGYTRFCLTAIAVLLAVLIVGLWASAPVSDAGSAAAARAPDVKAEQAIIPNAAAQRLAILKAAQETNKKLDKIVAVLKSGEVRVALVEAGREKAEGDAGKKPKK